TGVVKKVEAASKKISDFLEKIIFNNEPILITKIEVDVFGFSRGAAAARHFVNDLRRGRNSQLAQTLRGEESLATDFDWRFGHGLRVNLIGLFDTVAAIGTFSDGWNVHD